ncbi:hypothetical protein OG883_45320 [Streptomyces sp. NBC_01142]|uniref:hypothetical protein n=1 Tax=Streptomyces sp. NBC_01142 TaxID=2975865 RepID=UPI00225682BB|nr:hypothetical protein [Streptomyces sp. NBC_01142]MCX4826861.1 hypothetical protein [Streptomyces sp. NBC_01142]
MTEPLIGAVHERIIETSHFQPDDVVHVIGSLMDARHFGQPHLVYRVRDGRGAHASGEPALLLHDRGTTVRAPARYLIHLKGCAQCAIFEAELREETTTADYGDSAPREVMLMARSADGQLLHILDVLRIQDELGY